MHTDDHYEQNRRAPIRHQHAWRKVDGVDVYGMTDAIDITWIQPGPGNHVGDDIICRCDCGAVMRRDSMANYLNLFYPPSLPADAAEGIARGEPWTKYAKVPKLPENWRGR